MHGCIFRIGKCSICVCFHHLIHKFCFTVHALRSKQSGCICRRCPCCVSSSQLSTVLHSPLGPSMFSCSACFLLQRRWLGWEGHRISKQFSQEALGFLLMPGLLRCQFPLPLHCHWLGLLCLAHLREGEKGLCKVNCTGEAVCYKTLSVRELQQCCPGNHYHSEYNSVTGCPDTNMFLCLCAKIFH